MKAQTFLEFKETLKLEAPNANWSEALKSLWYEANGDWNASHNIAQDLHTEMGSWIHAYLHRKEGDDWNAGYWYRQANKSFPESTLEEELKAMIEYALNH
ncbi:MAG: hypothetical protein BM563_02340 [Bacteroidetes bacterium MedPE-SWsnd-G1]|nr:MAG: hypothetical protein BM563_02340 [Bacteroidetes bacterium MedPE-SWsnd-G1]